MPRGRFWYGPGFWKRGTDWVPGSGGFRGGANPYLHQEPAMTPWGWAPCHYWGPPPTREEEARFLREQADYLKSELDALEKRLHELGKEEKGQD